jgi:hypothetical protein
MRNLIKNILREYLNNQSIIIEVIGSVSERKTKVIIENSSRKKVRFSPEIRKKIDSEFKELKEKVSRINPFYGSFTDKYTGIESTIEFNIVVGLHFVERQFRKEDPKYKKDERVVNPSSYEGIDLLVYNRDRLAQEILTKRIKHNDLVKISTKDGTHYQMLVTFNKIDKKDNVPSFNLFLVNQIKGIGLNFYDSDKEVKVNSPK